MRCDTSGSDASDKVDLGPSDVMLDEAEVPDSTDLSQLPIPIEFGAHVASSVAALQVRVASVDLIPASREDLRRSQEGRNMETEADAASAIRISVRERYENDGEVTENGELRLETDNQDRYVGDGFATHGGLGWPGNRRVGIGRIDGESIPIPARASVA